MKLKGNMTFLIRDGETYIRLIDKKSRIRFLEVTIDNDSLIKMMSGLAEVELEFEVNRLSDVGKKKEVIPFSFETNHSWHSNKSELDQEIINHCPAGYEPNFSMASKSSFTYIPNSSKRIANCTAYRYVEDTDNVDE